MATFGTVSTTQQHNPNKSFEVVSPPTDGISSLSFSSKANYLVASSWDNQVLLAVINSNSWKIIYLFINLFWGCNYGHFACCILYMDM
jgi:hypothetical protein